MIAPTNPAAQASQLPSLLQMALGGTVLPPSASASGATNGLLPNGLFQASGAQAFTNVLGGGVAGSATIPTAGQQLGNALVPRTITVPVTANPTPAPAASLSAVPVSALPTSTALPTLASSVPTASPASTPLAMADSSQMGGMIQQVVVMLLAVVFQALMQEVGPGGGGVPIPAQTPTTPAPATPTSVLPTAALAAAPNPAPAAVARPASAPVVSTALNNTTANAAQRAQLDSSLAAVARDPDGAKLLAAARARGVSIEVGDPALAAGAFDVAVNCDCAAHLDAGGAGTAQFDGPVVVNGVTLSDTRGGPVRIVVRDASNIKTIVHELVHAVSTGDGNSKEEEGIADVLGSRVANRVGGAGSGGLTGTDQQIFINKQQFYPTLSQVNPIRNTLAGIGVNVAV